MKHELLYNPRQQSRPIATGHIRCFSGSLGLGYSSSLICGFPLWGKEEEELATTWSSPLFSDLQFTMNGGIQSYCGNNVNFINCISLTSQEHNYSEIFCLLDLTGALVNQFSRLRMILRKRIQHSNWSECALLVITFSNVFHSHVHARMCVGRIFFALSNRRWSSLFVDAWDCFKI